MFKRSKLTARIVHYERYLNAIYMLIFRLGICIFLFIPFNVQLSFLSVTHEIDVAFLFMILLFVFYFK